ncbi:5-carboxy-2-oxohept-3-enedioate decarboxylase HpaG2 subunit [Salsuginibacillus halophilus]|uniref:5-carboxy-2-oxohept-3-enedioate decarboxylase HpaG2 subunit n=1 Tax=Salsuginibacillus halophilus TaxID=517424 RepID=A0A2P8HQH6_9BACI|nr:fumarylacetoacetate hydrolase family protein [Salsuginibacillus halophilus]PSL48467.1 5-carboxy-2-oxohept-3-enedioate decarboxylase HpaG2 subunit [Salsuginibacillus halophilus]
MKHAIVAAGGAVHQASATDDGRVQLPDGRTFTETEVTWLSPVEPRTIFALGLNYADHASELSFQAPKEPLAFLKGPNTLIGHNASTKRPEEVELMHYECELGVVIGKEAKDVAKENAYEYVKGYTVANDYAIRDYLENYYRPNLRVKNRDTCTPIGPWLVDRDDIKDPMNLSIRTQINGKTVQEGSTKDMIFDVSDLIAYFSSFMTLNENDIILTGTPKGTTGVHPGDEVITEIESIGSLRNYIASDQTFQKA